MKFQKVEGLNKEVAKAMLHYLDTGGIETNAGLCQATKYYIQDDCYCQVMYGLYEYLNIKSFGIGFNPTRQIAAAKLNNFFNREDVEIHKNYEGWKYDYKIVCKSKDAYNELKRFRRWCYTVGCGIKNIP